MNPKVVRWWPIPPDYGELCEGTEIGCDDVTPMCFGQVVLGCQTDNGSNWMVCRQCARRHGYREANGR